MASADHPNRPVLLAGRNRHVRELLARELAREGFEVRESAPGPECVSQVCGEAAMLVLDVELPGLDVLGIIRRARGVRPGLPVALFAHREDEVGECLKEPGVYFVHKDEDPGSLVRTVRGMLERNTA